MNHRRIPAHPYLLLALATLFWSGNFILGRAVRTVIPPVGLAFWRWFLALAVVLPFSTPHLKRQWPAILRSWKTAVLLGVLGIGSFNTLVYTGLHETTATNAILLNSACPAMILAITFLIGGQIASFRQSAGVFVSLLGIVTIVCKGSLETMFSLSFNRGDMWVLGAMTCWSLYTILLKHKPQGIHPLALLTSLMAVGVAFLLPLHAWEISRGGKIVADVPTIAALSYLALLPSLAAYIFWNQAVEELGANRAGTFLHLMPAFGSLLAVLLLGESFRWYHTAGIASILTGVWLACGSRPPPREVPRADGSR